MNPQWLKNRPDMNLPAYKSWRNAVFACHDFTCVLCKRKGVPLECHHIVPYSVDESLRYIVSNGVPMCHECHLKVTGKEKEYEAELKMIVQSKKQNSGKGHKRDSKPWFPKKWYPQNPRNIYRG